MDIFSSLAEGFSVAVLPINILLLISGCFIGTMVGALPGLGPVNGVAILIPLTFALNLDATSSLILLSSVYYGCMYGGRVSAILLNIPGDEPAIMTTLDGYPMAQKGHSKDALAISAVASFIGATLATIGLTLFAPLLAKAAIYFGPADYFALYVLAFATIGGISTVDLRKTLLSALIGLMIATIGLDPSTGIARFTMNSFKLYDGLDLIVMLVGLFAISEILIVLEKNTKEHSQQLKVEGFLPKWKPIQSSLGSSLRGSGIGFLAGVLPGAGAALGAVVSYTIEKQFFNRENTFGNGDPRGVAAPEAGNNAASGGALIPMLALGVPGSGTTAVMLAMLVSLNVQPGPLLFETNPNLVWGLVASLYMANLALLLLNIPMIGIFTSIMRTPNWVLLPIVIAISFVGVYSLSRSTFDLTLMIGFGVFGYLLRKFQVSLVPLILGLLLGTDMENNLRRALSISGGDWTVLVSSPISTSLYVVTALLLICSIYFSWNNSKNTLQHDIKARSN